MKQRGSPFDTTKKPKSKRGGNGKNKKGEKVIHQGLDISKYINPIQKWFLIWALFVAVGEFLVVAWPATALVIWGINSALTWPLFVYAIRALLLGCAALSKEEEEIRHYHGMAGVRGNPFRILTTFRKSTALTIWWALSYIVGGLFGVILTIAVGATYTAKWHSGHRTLYWLSLGFYIFTTIESFIIPTFFYRKALDDNFNYYKNRVKRKSDKKKETFELEHLQDVQEV